MEPDTTAPAIPGWKQVDSKDVDHGKPFLCWYEDEESSDPIYYLPVEEPEQASPSRYDDQYMRERLITALNGDLAAAKRAYSWVANIDEPVESRREGSLVDGTFSQALADLKAGARVTRAGWNGKGMWLQMQVPDEHSKMRLPYIYISSSTGQLVPWVASQTDLLSNDWTIY